MWHLHSHEGTIETFGNLTELAKSLITQSRQKLRLAPSEYGKIDAYIRRTIHAKHINLHH